MLSSFLVNHSIVASDFDRDQLECIRPFKVSVVHSLWTFWRLTILWWNTVFVRLMFRVLFVAHYPADNPVGIIVGSAVAVVICMIIVLAMIVIFIKRYAAWRTIFILFRPVWHRFRLLAWPSNCPMIYILLVTARKEIHGLQLKRLLGRTVAFYTLRLLSQSRRDIWRRQPSYYWRV